MKGVSLSAGRRRAPGRGFTLLEVLIALTILSLAVLGTVSVVYYSQVAQDATREQSLAYNAARERLEQMRGVPFSEVYARYNADPSDDPGGPGTAAGARFEVPSLQAPEGAPAGTVSFPEHPDLPGIREDVRDAQLGMAEGRDLNGDGKIDSASHSHDYKILPVRIVIRWRTSAKDESFEVHALLGEK